KNEYSLNFVRFERTSRAPESLTRKVLTDVLSNWSNYAIKDQNVLAYRIAVLSPEILAPTDTEKADAVVAAQMLRTLTLRLLDNLAELQKLPGAELARSPSGGISLEEVRLRLEETQRYRIEPLVSRAAKAA